MIDRLRCFLLFALSLGSWVGWVSGAEKKPAYETLGFNRLGDFPLDTSALDPSLNPTPDKAPTVDPQIPARIWAWQNKRVEVTGYMMPVRFNGDKVTEFMLFASPSACCYGVVPKLNEWINVVAPQGTDAKMDIPLRVRGTFAVGTRHEEGYVTGIYHLSFESASEEPSSVANAASVAK